MSIRVIIQQPSLAKYRVPVFRELASRSGIDLTVIYGKRKGIPNVDPDGFDAIAYPLRMAQFRNSPVFFHRPQWSAASTKRTDVLILTWNVRYVSLLPGLLRARASGVKTVLWGHGFSKREKASRSRVRSWVTNYATALMFYNERAAQIHRDLGIPDEKLFVALNSLDQEPIEAATQHWTSRPDELRRFQVENEIDQKPLILYVSRLDPNNRVDLLIEAAAQLKKSGQNLQVAIIGSGDQQLSELKQLADHRGVGEDVKFLGAIYQETELAPWFLSAKAFCYPCNIGLSLLHAFGYGLPVITSNNLASQNPEIEALQHEQNGLLYRDGELGDLSDSLARLLNDESARKKMSDAALSTVQDKFSLTHMVDGIEAAIRYCDQQGK